VFLDDNRFKSIFSKPTDKPCALQSWVKTEIKSSGAANYQVHQIPSAARSQQ